jgi:hypothetical protein
VYFNLISLYLLGCGTVAANEIQRRETAFNTLNTDMLVMPGHSISAFQHYRKITGHNHDSYEWSFILAHNGVPQRNGVVFSADEKTGTSK